MIFVFRVCRPLSFRIFHVQSLGYTKELMTENTSRIQRKSIKNRSNIDRKSIENPSKIEPKTIQGSSERLETILGRPWALPRRPWDAPTRHRDSVGTVRGGSRDPWSDPKTVKKPSKMRRGALAARFLAKFAHATVFASILVKFVDPKSLAFCDRFGELFRSEIRSFFDTLSTTFRAASASRVDRWLFAEPQSVSPTMVFSQDSTKSHVFHRGAQ